MRKLVDLTSLHLRSVDEFKDGGLHPGYAFPLWHELLALVSWFSGVDPGVRRAPRAVACSSRSPAPSPTRRASRSSDRAAAGVSLLALTLAVFCFGPGHGGSWATLSLPGTAARQLLVPAAIALFFANNASGVRPRSSARSRSTHPTYALFLLVPLTLYALLRVDRWRRSAPLLAAALVPTGLTLLWLKPIVDETISHDPGPAERLRALAPLRRPAGRHERPSLPPRRRRSSAAAARSPSRRSCSCRSPASSLRRRWATFALGGSLAILLLTEVPWLFVHFSDAVSLSQSRRIAGFAPLPFALVGRARPAARARCSCCPLALVAGIVLQRLWPGDFDYGLRHGGRRSRPGSRSSAASPRSSSAAFRRVRASRAARARRCGGGVSRAAGVRPRRLALEPRVQQRSRRSLAAPRPPAAHGRAEGARS